MDKIDAQGKPLSAPLVRQTLTRLSLHGVEPSCVESSYEQRVEWENNAPAVQCVRVGRLHSSPTEHFSTLGGIRIREDATMPKDEIRFVDDDGRVLAVISNIKTPDWAVA